MSSFKKILGLSSRGHKKSKKLGLPPPYDESSPMEIQPSAPLSNDFFGVEDMDLYDKDSLRYEKFRFMLKMTVRSNKPFRSYDDVTAAVSQWDNSYIGMVGKRPFYKIIALIGSSHLQATPAVLADLNQPEYYATLTGRCFLPHRLGLIPPMFNVSETFRKPFNIGIYKGTLDFTFTVSDDESNEKVPHIWEYMNPKYQSQIQKEGLKFGLILSKKATGTWVLDQLSPFK